VERNGYGEAAFEKEHDKGVDALEQQSGSSSNHDVEGKGQECSAHAAYHAKGSGKVDDEDTCTQLG
jgi:hypothetical protein